MLLPLKDITTTAEDTWGEWTTPEECTIKTEDTKAEFQKTDAFMTTAVVIREGKAPMVGTTTKAEDIKAAFKTTTKNSAKNEVLRGLIFLSSSSRITRLIFILTVKFALLSRLTI